MSEQESKSIFSCDFLQVVKSEEEDFTIVDKERSLVLGFFHYFKKNADFLKLQEEKETLKFRSITKFFLSYFGGEVFVLTDELMSFIGWYEPIADFISRNLANIDNISQKEKYQLYQSLGSLKDYVALQVEDCFENASDLAKLKIKHAKVETLYEDFVIGAVLLKRFWILRDSKEIGVFHGFQTEKEYLAFVEQLDSELEVMEVVEDGTNIVEIFNNVSGQEKLFLVKDSTGHVFGWYESIITYINRCFRNYSRIETQQEKDELAILSVMFFIDCFLFSNDYNVLEQLNADVRKDSVDWPDAEFFKMQQTVFSFCLKKLSQELSPEKEEEIRVNFVKTFGGDINNCLNSEEAPDWTTLLEGDMKVFFQELIERFKEEVSGSFPVKKIDNNLSIIAKAFLRFSNWENADEAREYFQLKDDFQRFVIDVCHRYLKISYLPKDFKIFFEEVIQKVKLEVTVLSNEQVDRYRSMFLEEFILLGCGTLEELKEFFADQSFFEYFMNNVTSLILK